MFFFLIIIVFTLSLVVIVQQDAYGVLGCDASHHCYAGNTATKEQTITIQDTTKPEYVSPIINYTLSGEKLVLPIPVTIPQAGHVAHNRPTVDVQVNYYE